MTLEVLLAFSPLCSSILLPKELPPKPVFQLSSQASTLRPFPGISNAGGSRCLSCLKAGSSDASKALSWGRLSSLEKWAWVPSPSLRDSSRDLNRLNLSRLTKRWRHRMDQVMVNLRTVSYTGQTMSPMYLPPALCTPLLAPMHRTLWRPVLHTNSAESMRPTVGRDFKPVQFNPNT